MRITQPRRESTTKIGQTAPMVELSEDVGGVRFTTDERLNGAKVTEIYC